LLAADDGGSVVGHLTGSLGEASDIRPIRGPRVLRVLQVPAFIHPAGSAYL